MPTTIAHPEPNFEAAAEIQRFWEANYDRFLRDFAEHFIAVDIESGEVVASNCDLAGLAGDLVDLGLDPRTDVAIEFISDRYGSLLL